MRLLFVCLGNICRSPAAETIMRHFIERESLDHLHQVDSAGTAGYHIGSLPDPRSRKALTDAGYQGWSRCRQVSPEDFHSFDYVFPMDQQNLRALRQVCPEPELFAKVKLICEFASTHREKEVPDPYYGSEEDFAFMVRLLEDCCQGISRSLLNPSKG